MLNVEHLCEGVMHWHDNDKMDDLMEFLVRYVRHAHSDQYYKNLLIENPGATFLDVITPCDVAYVIALMENGKDMWTTPEYGDGNKVKPLFTSGKNMKRTYGMNIWTEDGMDFYEKAHMFWHAAFNRSCHHYDILHKYWDKWIARNGKTLFIGKSESSRKTAFSVLATREAAAMARRKKKAARQVREFKYESDDDGSGNICAGNWGAARMTSNTIPSRNRQDGRDDNERVGEDDEVDEQSSESEGNGSSSEDETTNINENGKRSGHNMRRGG